jgi:hypothetical protein
LARLTLNGLPEIDDVTLHRLNQLQ